MTRLLELDASETAGVTNQAVLASFTNSGHSQSLATLAEFARCRGQQASAIILPEIPPDLIDDATRIWKVDLNQDGLSARPATLDQLMRAIRLYSGGDVRVGQKGLTFGTSSIECYLSKTTAAYPGDADALIVNADHDPRIIVELKKHTLDSPITEHLVSRYYPNPDGRKYDRLDCLARAYGAAPTDSGAAVPIAILCYSTKAPVIRVQVVSRFTGHAAEIQYDSGDIDINRMDPQQIGQSILRHLAVLR